jgi:hypothetical protein
MRPQLVHFSGHGGGGGIFFDDPQIRDLDDVGDDAGEPSRTGLLVCALAATTTPPMLLVVNEWTPPMELRCSSLRSPL